MNKREFLGLIYSLPFYIIAAHLCNLPFLTYMGVVICFYIGFKIQQEFR